jgi:homoserine O-acetyltransferase
MWWGNVLGPGKALDTDQFFIVCMNNLGSCYGTCGPTSPKPGSDAARAVAYGSSFPPVVSIRDAVRLQRLVLKEAFGVTSVACAIGGSMGGMIALEMCYRDTLPGLAAAPPLAQSAVLLSTNGRHSAWQIAMSELQRRAIAFDPQFKGGEYSEQPHMGLELARSIAMVSYRTHNAYETTFGRLVREGDGGQHSYGYQDVSGDAPAKFQVASYLDYQGKKFVAQRNFDANSYMTLTRMMDSHDVSRGRGIYPEVLGHVTQPTLVVGITSDVLYPVREQEVLYRHLGNCREFHRIESDEGHDGFLLETQQVSDIITRFLRDHVTLKDATKSVAPMTQPSPRKVEVYWERDGR